MANRGYVVDVWDKSAYARRQAPHAASESRSRKVRFGYVAEMDPRGPFQHLETWRVMEAGEGRCLTEF